MNCDREADFDAGFDLCFKCSRLSNKLHWTTHHLVQYGDNVSEADASEAGSSAPSSIYEVDDDITEVNVGESPAPQYEIDEEE